MRNANFFKKRNTKTAAFKRHQLLVQDGTNKTKILSSSS